jgi:hypothetical protein
VSWKRNQGKLPVNDPSVLIGGQNIVSYYVQSGKEEQQRVPAAQEFFRRHGSQCAAVQSGQPLQFFGGGATAWWERSEFEILVFPAGIEVSLVTCDLGGQKSFYRQSDRFSDERRHRIADQAESMRPGFGKTEPVREALHPGGFAWCQGSVLGGMDEHQPILAQMGDNGAARMPAALAGVAVLEAGLVVGKLKLDAAIAHGGGGILTLSQKIEVAQVALTVGTGNVVCEFLRTPDFQNSRQIAGGGHPFLVEMVVAPVDVVFDFIFTPTGSENRQVTDGYSQHGAGFGAGRGLQLRDEIAGQVIAHADDELAAAFLRYTEFPGIFNLCVDSVAGASDRPPQFTSLLLDGGEVFATGGAADSKDVLHHKHARLEEIHVVQQFAEKVAARIVFEARAMVGTVHLTGRAEALARGTPDNDIDLVGAKQFCELSRWKSS